MHKVLVAGAGTMGTLVASLLRSTNAFDVRLVDLQQRTTHIKLEDKTVSLISEVLDVTDESTLLQYLEKHQIECLISCLPYFNTLVCAKACRRCDVHYFDLTEDVSVTQAIQQLAMGAKSVLMPQCGLAPGVISIIARHLIASFDAVHDVSLRVGALPLNTDNPLKYGFTWSLDGLINQYCNAVEAIENQSRVLLKPLEGLSDLTIDGVAYEVFNTSGGLGTLAQTYAGKVRKMDYKSMRYPGHCEKMQFLLTGLKLSQDRETLKNILKKSIPSTQKDVVIIYASVSGYRDDHFYEKNYVTKIYRKIHFGHKWTAIQWATASSLCAVVDMVLSEPQKYRGFVKQEDLSFTTFIHNRFGSIYANHKK